MAQKMHKQAHEIRAPLLAAWRDIETPVGKVHLFTYTDGTWSDTPVASWVHDPGVVWDTCLRAAQQGALIRYPGSAYGRILPPLRQPDHVEPQEQLPESWISW